MSGSHCSEASEFGQVELPDEIKVFIRESTGNYGKVKMVLHRNKFFVESPFPDILRTLLKASPSLPEVLILSHSVMG